MSGFLERVVSEKRIEVAERKEARPLEGLLPRAFARDRRDFKSALNRGGGIIAEIKGRSPRVEAFRQKGPPEDLARVYQANGASAISIVTDEARFGTSLRDVEAVRAAAGLPVLVKDFVIDDYQVVEARAAGADAVLLIARILCRSALAALLGRVHMLGIPALVECHDGGDLDKALNAGAGIVGINNRDLNTMEVSLDTTRRLVRRIPEGVCCVSESGIEHRGQVEALRGLGVRAFLVGGSLLMSRDPGRKLRALAGIRNGDKGKGP